MNNAGYAFIDVLIALVVTTLIAVAAGGLLSASLNSAGMDNHPFKELIEVRNTLYMGGQAGEQR